MKYCKWRAQGCCTMKDRATRIPRPATGMPTNIIRIFVLNDTNSNRTDFYSRRRRQKRSSAGILEQSMRVRSRVGIGLSYRPARLCRLAESIPGLFSSLKISPQYSTGIGRSCTISVANPHNNDTKACQRLLLVNAVTAQVRLANNAIKASPRFSIFVPERFTYS